MSNQTVIVQIEMKEKSRKKNLVSVRTQYSNNTNNILSGGNNQKQIKGYLGQFIIKSIIY